LQPVERVGAALDLQAVGGLASGQVDEALPVGDDADGGLLGGTAGGDLDHAVVHPDGHADGFVTAAWFGLAALAIAVFLMPRSTASMTPGSDGRVRRRFALHRAEGATADRRRRRGMDDDGGRHDR
jgi:hypothetical protein